MKRVVKVLVGLLGVSCALLALTVAVGSAAGAQSAVSVDARPFGSQSVFVIPFWPLPKARIPQNVSTLGCAAHPTAGSGFGIVFRWMPIPSWRPDRAIGIRGYRLRVQHQDAPNPALDVTLAGASSTSYRWVSCNSFVIDSNLDDWIWSVTAVDSEGHVVASSHSSFLFLPCRLDAQPGQPCYSNPS